VLGGAVDEAGIDIERFADELERRLTCTPKTDVQPAGLGPHPPMAQVAA
jgi:hypothetical protein